MVGRAVGTPRGFAGGLLYQQNQGTSSATGGVGGASGGFTGGAAAGSVVGTVVSGGTLYIWEGTSSARVKVEPSPTSTVTVPSTAGTITDSGVAATGGTSSASSASSGG